MNGQIFNILGYLSVLLGFSIPVLWILHVVRRPRRWLCHYAVGVAVAALLFATINSMVHVNRIQIDRSEELAAAQALQEQARKAREKERADDVAPVRFAEDDSADFLDTAGMDDAEKKYLENAGKPKDVQAWKKEKKTRSAGGGDDSLEAMLDPGAEQDGGLDVGGGVEKGAVESILMPEKQYAMAHRLDALNLQTLRLLLYLGVIIVVLDYLRRVNVYGEAYGPLPLPSSWVQALTPMPEVWTRPDPPRRTMPEELRWLSRRGDVFLYLTDNERAGRAVPEVMHRLPGTLCPVDVLRVAEGDALVDDTFVFETLWYGRASFVVDTLARAEQLLTTFTALLRGRRETRARVRQTVHIVWDLRTPMPEVLRDELVMLARVTGLSLLEVGNRQLSNAMDGPRKLSETEP